MVTDPVVHGKVRHVINIDLGQNDVTIVCANQCLQAGTKQLARAAPTETCTQCVSNNIDYVIVKKPILNRLPGPYQL